MTTQYIETLTTGSVDTLIAVVKKLKPALDFDKIAKQYGVSDHLIFNVTLRKDKQILDDNGGLIDTKKVARLGLPLQQKIVKTAAAFLCGKPIKLTASPKDKSEAGFLQIIQRVWDDNKLDYKSKRIAKHLFSETEVAELWYNPEAEEAYWQDTAMKASYKLRMRILANSLGDTLYPVFDDAGDMAAFGRGFTLISDTDEKVECMDIYTPSKIIRASKASGSWTSTEEVNTIGKIPIIYYKQPMVEWADVQPMIERMETKLSNHSDTNDYFDSPVLFIEGDPQDMPDKEEMGKMIKGERGSKAYYVTWDNAPESTKMEIENLWRFIHNCTDTPDISFEAMKSLGNAPSGYAIELMFLAAHLKAADKEENFGESVQRRINYIKTWLGVMDKSQAKFLYMPVKPKFEYFLPENITEKVDLLNASVAGGIMSTETAIRSNPLVDDPDNELELLDNQADPLDTLMGGVVKPITNTAGVLGGSNGQVPSAKTGLPTGKI